MELPEKKQEQRNFKMELKDIKKDITGLKFGINEIKNMINSVVNSKKESNITENNTENIVNNTENTVNNENADIADSTDNTENIDNFNLDEATEVDLNYRETAQAPDAKDMSIDLSYDSRIKFIIDNLQLSNYESSSLLEEFETYIKENELYDLLIKNYSKIKLLYTESICLHCEQADLLRVIKAFYSYYADSGDEAISQLVNIYTENTAKIHKIYEDMKTYYDKIRIIIHNISYFITSNIPRKKVSQDLLKLKNISKEIDVFYLSNDYSKYINGVLYHMNIYRLINLYPNFSYLFKPGKTIKNFTFYEIKDKSFLSIVDDLQLKYENQLYKYEFIPNQPKAFYLNRN